MKIKKSSHASKLVMPHARFSKLLKFNVKLIVIDLCGSWIAFPKMF